MSEIQPAMALRLTGGDSGDVHESLVHIGGFTGGVGHADGCLYGFRQASKHRLACLQRNFSLLPQRLPVDFPLIQLPENARLLVAPNSPASNASSVNTKLRARMRLRVRSRKGVSISSMSILTTTAQWYPDRPHGGQDGSAAVIFALGNTLEAESAHGRRYHPGNGKCLRRGTRREAGLVEDRDGPAFAED